MTEWRKSTNTWLRPIDRRLPGRFCTVWQHNSDITYTYHFGIHFYDLTSDIILRLRKITGNTDQRM